MNEKLKKVNHSKIATLDFPAAFPATLR